MRSRPRHRGHYLLAALAAIALGLATRRWPGLLPAMFGKYPGEALWALMAFFGWAAILPAASTWRLAALALGTAWGVELLKLWQAPWLVHLRHTTLGHLVLGHAFSWQNLMAYGVGVGLGLGVEPLYSMIRSVQSSHPSTMR